MKFAVLQFFSWSRRVPIATVYERALDRIAIMDETGYDAVWIAEHHFNTYSVCPSPLLMATHVAAVTKNLRIGTGVTLAAFYNPLRLAEEVAMLDVLSGGRVNWGSGRGFDVNEFRAFQVPREESAERYLECVEIVLEAWRSERFSFQGKYWQYDDVELLPKPLQQPAPPHWLATGSLGAIERAAQRGYSVMLGPHSDHDDIANKRRFYAETLAQHGHTIEGRTTPIARLIAIAPTEAEAREVAHSGADWTVASYANPDQGGTASMQKKPGVDPVERYLNDVVIYGTPEQVTDKLLELEERIPLDYLLAAPLSHESFLLLTEKVMPKLSG